MSSSSGSDGSPSTGGQVADESNLNPIIQLTSWLLIAMTSLVLGFRFMTQCYVKGNARFTLEDALIVTAYILSLGEYATTIIPESRVFGRDMTRISDQQLKTGLKAKDMLFVICIRVSKLSASLSLFSISPDRNHRVPSSALITFITLFAISGLLATAFQCGTHVPSEGGTLSCPGQESIWKYVAGASIVTDLALVVLAIYIMLPLKMAIKTRLGILAFYSTRVLAVVATSFQLYYLPRLFQANFTLRATPYYVCTQVAQFASISSACFVYFWPFMRSLRSGMMQTNNTSFVSHYPLATLSGPTPKKSEQSANTSGSGSGSDRKGYIKLTRDVSVNFANSLSRDEKMNEQRGVGDPDSGSSLPH